MNQSELVAVKARAEFNMMIFDDMPKRARNLANQYGLAAVSGLFFLYNGNVDHVERDLKIAMPGVMPL